MAQRFQSGAFVQQCFAVHPLCLSLKRLDEQGRLIIACTSCRMMHQMVSGQVVARVAAKIYRVGILMYGKRPSMRELWRWLRY